MPIKTLLNALKINTETAPLNGGKKLYLAARADKSYRPQYQKWKKDNPQINWKEKEKEWNK